MPNPSDRRLRVVAAVFALAFCGLFVQAFRLQVLEHEHLGRLAKEQYLGHVKIPARRGNVYDVTGTPMAISVDVPSVYANPAAITDRAHVARCLAPLLHLPAATLQQKLAAGRYFVWLKRHVTPPVGEAVRALRLPGIGISEEPKRSYPNNEVAAHVLGLAGTDGAGLEGIEQVLDSHLLGAPQMVAALRDARGRGVLHAGLDVEQRARGGDVTLTVDLQVQHLAEQALARAVTTTGARWASAVVLDVPTGNVLALAQAPTFSANRAGQTPPEVRRNRILTDLIEPGSTLKPLVVGAALDAGAVHPHTMLYCEHGRYAIRGHTISDTHPHGWLTLTDVLAKSSNIGMAKVAEMLQKEPLERALRNFGIGTRTGVEFPGEVAGVLRDAHGWSPLETATVAFGQGMAVNSLQLAAAYRALAADGMYVAPRLVHSVRRSDGHGVRLPRAEGHRALSVDAARRVTRMLEAAIMPAGGTGRLAAVEGYRVAGKTGTAQKADAVTRGYSKDRFVALFAGYLPAEAPRAVIVVAVDEPKTNHYGGVVAAPVFAEIGAAAMHRLGVLASAGVPQARPSAEEAATLRVQPVALAAGIDEAALERPATPAAAGGAHGRLPSFVGMTPRQAVDAFVRRALPGELTFSGSGRVVRQQPPAGAAPAEVTHLVLGEGTPASFVAPAPG